MALSGVKDNKCFEPVTGLIYSGSQSVTVPADTNWEDGSFLVSFDNDAITTTNSVVITIRENDNHALMQVGKIEERHEIINGGVLVFLTNSDTAAHNITVNCIVL